MNELVPSYEKMAEDPRRWGVSEAGFRSMARSRWVVSEKIHGANLCIEATPAGCRASCRSRWLGLDDDFFGFQPVLERLAPQARSLAALLAGEGVERVLIYGELFGGRYPHPEVPPAPGIEPVQTGVWYAPDLHFFAFDVALDGPGGKRYLGHDQASELLDRAGLPHVHPLAVVSYSEAMAFPLGQATAVPAALGLPAIEGNVAEGVVLRPQGELLVPDEQGRLVRPLLKRKIAAFAEDARFHQARQAAAAPASEVQAIQQHGSWLVNEPRLAAARSKLGPVERQGARGQAALVALVLEDVGCALRDDWGARLDALNASERARLDAYLRGEIEALIALVL